MITWTDSVGVLAHVGEKRQKLLEGIGLATIGDLVFHLPFRYENWDDRPGLDGWMEEGRWLVYQGEVTSFSSRAYGPGKRQTLLIAQLQGPQGPVEAVWFNRPHLAKQMAAGRQIVLSGKIRTQRGLQIHVEKHHFLKAHQVPADFRGYQPIYPTTEGLPQTTLKQLIGRALKELLPSLEAPFPAQLVASVGLIPFKEALAGIHHPASEGTIEVCRQSLAAFEFFALLYGTRASHSYEALGQAMVGDQQLRQAYRASLPYDLTPAQERVVEDISRDMASPNQMHRLLQGDVGSGKTTVAVLSLLQAVEAGKQGVLMAPTEVLARQHYDTMSSPFEKIGVRACLLTGQVKGKEREDLLRDLASGQIQIAIGTHALLEKTVAFEDLGLVVIDEQHRFGVRQRQVLIESSPYPDLLVMTATPIPRSLALTVYGHLDLSVIDALPKGRGQIQTIFMRESKRQDMYAFVAKEIAQGRQAYVVAPLIESSDKMDLQDAGGLYETLSQEVFPQVQVDLLHGRLSSREKEEVMHAFRQGETQLLVATTVIEVGIDVPNANVMIIEDADRFGLSQLHQLRGRIGRGAHKSYCILISRSESKDALDRLHTFVYAKDGFAIAEADLKQRGAGELLGLRQHGQDLFKVADPVTDHKPLAQAQALQAQAELLDPAWRHRLMADMARKTRS